MSVQYKDGKYYGKVGSPMPAEDMAEVASPLPSVMSRLPILFDESGAERIVGWYKYANGTKQPVYQKEITGLNVAVNGNTNWTNIYNIGAGYKLIYCQCFGLNGFYTIDALNLGITPEGMIEGIFDTVQATNSRVISKIVVQYIKSTDTPV